MLVAFLVVSVCFTTVTAIDRPHFLIDTQHIGNLREAATSASIIVGASLHGSNSTQPLDQPTRLQIYNYIKDNSGVHFRGICDCLGLSVGVVQYHLDVLEHAGLVTAFMDGQSKRYFEHSTIAKSDVKLISLMRHDTTAKILTVLTQNDSALHKDIAGYLGISSQALSWHMNELKKTGLVNAERTGVNVKYSLNDANIAALISLLSAQLKPQMNKC